jgi:hypothetical protein
LFIVSQAASDHILKEWLKKGGQETLFCPIVCIRNNLYFSLELSINSDLEREETPPFA